MKTNIEAGMAQTSNCNDYDSVIIATCILALIIASATLYVYFQEKREKQLFYGDPKGDDLDNWDEFERFLP